MIHQYLWKTKYQVIQPKHPEHLYTALSCYMQETQQNHCAFISLCTLFCSKPPCSYPWQDSVPLRDSEGHYGLPQKSLLNYLCTSFPHGLGKSKVRNRPLIHRSWSCCKHIPMVYAKQLAGCRNFKCCISARKCAWILFQLVVTK